MTVIGANMLTNKVIWFFFSNDLQEQLRRRREEEDRIAQQNEFLRASLRGSRKLQALQDNPLVETRQPVGIENDAFTADDEVEQRILGELERARAHHIIFN